MIEEVVDWKLVERVVQVIFILCFREKQLKIIKSEAILKVIVDCALRAIEQNRIEVYYGIIRLFTFFSDD